VIWVVDFRSGRLIVIAKFLAAKLLLENHFGRYVLGYQCALHLLPIQDHFTFVMAPQVVPLLQVTGLELSHSFLVSFVN
jgi:hypothetical protein